MLYRLKQLYDAVFPQVEAQEYAWLASVLTSSELALFSRQTLTEQRHALDVAADLKEQKEILTSVYGERSYQNLLKAALLHDCGKSLFKLQLWQRIYIVILTYFPDHLPGILAKKRNILGKTLLIYKRHPVWGRRLAAKAGAGPEVQLLIEKHHSPRKPLELVLSEADNRH